MPIVKSFIAGAVIVLAGLSGVMADIGGSAASLRQSYSTLRNELDSSPFKRPLRLVSTQASNTLKGDIHAVIDHPFGEVRSSLSELKNWCDILILHPNVTNCHINPGAKNLALQIGRGGTPADFGFRVASSQPDYLNLQLTADQGPLGTRDYRIFLEAVPLDEKRTFIHLAYSHGFGMQAQLAMKAYLSTLGRDKVGFTVVGKTADGKPQHVGDFRGALERNAMRYYLAIEAYLDTLSAPAPERFEKRLQSWYASAERYPLQLHEEAEYLDLKRKLARSG